MLVDELPPKKQIIPPENWSELSLDELLQQKNLLYDRWEFLKLKGYAYESILLEGLHKLEEYIQIKVLGL